MPRMNITGRKLRRKSISSVAPSRDGQYAFDPDTGNILVSKGDVWTVFGYGAGGNGGDGGGEPAPFSPADVFANSEQGVWYDPSDLSTLFTDVEGTIPAGVNDTVALMLDKSGNGNHAMQATAAKRPTLMQDGGGRYYLSFDGTDDGMATSPIAPGTDKAQIFTGVDQTFGAGTGIIVEWSPLFSASANNGSFAISRDQTKISFNIRANSNAGWQPAFSQDGAETLSLQIDVSGATLSEELIPRRNGVIVQNNPTASETGTGTLAEKPLYIGARNQSQYFFNGKIYGIVIRFGPNLTTAEIEQFESWIADKTGVTVNGGGEVATQYGIASTIMTHSQIPVTVTAVGRSADTPIVTTGGSGLCHPKLIEAPGGWNGYRYWMVFTPYFGLVGQRDQYENPHVVASNDLNTWVEPAGGPIDLPEEGNGSYWSDTHIALDDSGVMHLWYRGHSFSFASRCFAYRTSTDGVNWSPRTIFNVPGSGALSNAIAGNEFLSPAFHEDEDVWACYDLVRNASNLGISGNNGSTQTHVVRRTASAVNGDFGPYLPENVVQYSPRRWGTSQDPWHLDAIKVGDLYIHLVNTSALGTSNASGLYLCTSTDGLNFDVHPALALPRAAYRSSVHAVRVDNDGITLMIAVGYYVNGTIDLFQVVLDAQP